MNMQVTRNKFLNRRGFGVHSPWAYDLITNVIEEKLPYYAYDDLYEYWEKAPEFLPQYDEKTDQLLFRLVNALHPRSILEIGTGAGVSTGYLASVSSATPCFTIDAKHPAVQQVAKLLEKFPNVQYFPGDILQTLQDFLPESRNVDFVHLAHTVFFEEAYEILRPNLNPHSVIVVQGINGRRSKWFEKVCKSEDTGVCFTKGSVGLLFFDKNMYKQYYRL